jgi:hypothetical protein
MVDIIRASDIYCDENMTSDYGDLHSPNPSNYDDSLTNCEILHSETVITVTEN